MLVSFLLLGMGGESGATFRPLVLACFRWGTYEGAEFVGGGGGGFPVHRRPKDLGLDCVRVFPFEKGVTFLSTFRPYFIGMGNCVFGDLIFDMLYWLAWRGVCRKT